MIPRRRPAVAALAGAQDDAERLQALELLADAPLYDGRIEEYRHHAARLATLADAVGDAYYATQAVVATALTFVYGGDPAAGRTAARDSRTALRRRYRTLSACTGADRRSSSQTGRSGRSATGVAARESDGR